MILRHSDVSEIRAEELFGLGLCFEQCANPDYFYLEDQLMANTRLKGKDLSAFRQTMYDEQNGICPLLGTHIEPDQMVLDHDHVTGHIRSVLSRNTNSIEGRILSFIGRLKGDVDPVEFLKRLIEYWEKDYSHNPIHPSEKTPEEKERLMLKRKLKKLKAPHAINRTKERIAELNAIIKEQNA